MPKANRTCIISARIPATRKRDGRGRFCAAPIGAERRELIARVREIALDRRVLWLADMLRQHRARMISALPDDALRRVIASA
jgi:hypothetical protein